MRVKKRKAVTLGVTARNNIPQSESYRKCAPRSSENLKDIIGELIFFLHGPISQSQRKAGWQFFEVLLGHYLTGKGAS